METFIPTFNTIIGIGTVLMQIFAVVLLAYLIFCLKKPSVFLDFVTKHAYKIGFFVSAMSVVLSLIYSEVIGFAPCFLCWYQRIFMYSLVVIFGVALYKKEKHVTDYALALTVLGTLVALYHNMMSWLPSANLPCSATGPSCTMIYANVFGYLTIPLMSLTGFVVALLTLIAFKTRKNVVIAPHENA
jgi:disulfide bond formation protein DsbB